MNAATRGSPNLFAFAALSFAVIFAWDVAYASLYDRGAAGLLVLIPGTVWLFVLPMVLNAALGFATRQWREGRGWPAAAAAVWCIVAPFATFVPFAWFMCVAFNSCFGD